MTFLADDQRGESGKITTHPLGMLMPARRLRISMPTDIRWPGHDTKCFRFEVLGCPGDVKPSASLAMRAVPGGWVVATWHKPTVLIAATNNAKPEPFTLEAENYLATMTRTGGNDDEEVIQSNSTTRRFMITGPLWGAIYAIALKCEYQGLSLNCGGSTLDAKVVGCNVTEQSCRIQNQVVFRRPSELKAEVVGEGEVQLSWTTEKAGWVTPTSSLEITDPEGNLVDQKTLSNKNNSVRVTGVSGGNNYTVTFIPEADSENLPRFYFSLHIIAWRDVTTSPRKDGYGAFVTDVDLSATIIWNGTLRVTWMSATVLGVTWNGDVTTTTADADATTTTAPPTTTTVMATTTLSTTAASPTTTNAVTTQPPNTTDTTANISTTTFPMTSTTTAAPTTTTAVPSTTTTTPPPTTTSTTTTKAVTEAPSLSVEHNTANAFMYTVTLSSDKGEVEHNVSMTSSPYMRHDFWYMSMEKQYSIALTCHFGGVSVQCGSYVLYVDKPLQWSDVNERFVVYAEGRGLGGWEHQEMECRKGAGTLVSLATYEEDERLLTALVAKGTPPHLDAYWLGLNMCPDYDGDVWSDGSLWQHSRLPNVRPMLSSETCCIKAVWKPEVQNYNWLGENCEALFPTVCEFHPQGLVGRIVDLQRSDASTTEAAATWKYQPDFWTPNLFVIKTCEVMDLEDLGIAERKASSDRCFLGNVTINATEFTQENLEPYKEYQVNVSASLTSIGYTGSSSAAFVRTHPETPVMVQVLPSGHLRVVWAQKVAEFAEDDNVVMKLTDGDGEEQQQTIQAKGVLLDGLKLGATYTVSLEELGGRRRKEAASVQAYPACECGEECHLRGWCFEPSPAKVNSITAIRECQDEEKSLATVSSSEQVDLLLKMADKVGDDLWVSERSERLSASRDTLRLLAEGDSEILDDESAAEPTTAIPMPSQCLVVSRAERAIVDEPCANIHTAACGRKVPVAKAFPPTSSMNIDVGASWISLDWSNTDWVWKATYTVYYQRTRERRYKRALKSMDFEAPPVLISNLQRDTSYTLELVADLDNGFLSSSNEFEASTANTSDGAYPERLKVGWAPSWDYQILQLVSAAIMVASCITTMLLFFATGMFYQDCVAQLGFLATVMAAYFNLMLAHPSTVNAENESGCIAVAIILHFLFTCAFMFLMLEALTIAHLLVVQIKSPFQNSNWLMMIAGVLIPGLIVCVSAAFVYSKYPDFTKHNCWLNPENSGMLAEGIPIVILLLSTLFLLLNTLRSQETPPALIEVDLRGRQSDSHKLRWVVLAMAVELFVVWATGTTAYQYHDSSLHVVFSAFTLILAFTIVGCRTTFDDTFRTKMHRLCCGTELTYKRSEILTLSGRSRVGPSPVQLMNTSAASNSPVRSVRSAPSSHVSATEERTSQVTTSSYSLPNTPPEEKTQDYILIRRSYNFNEDDPDDYY
ncbi:uncharacterized protein LOC119593586 [Penaeus monodon]|uniref:uncharacterized protein LOC119593586 n=1 Tax=Penaeus monodon TaxID=6687 RepID=UPI0018A76886|nr:uncharacterized protein LOC119593586 [Penaeus monodon]